MSTTSSNIYTHEEHDGHQIVTVVTEDEMIIRVIECVIQNPCLYDPNDPNYGNKPENLTYRNHVWRKLAENINFENGDANSMQQFWKRIRDRYIRERRRRIEAGEDDGSQTPSGSQSRGPSFYDDMRWLDPYLMESHNINHTETIVTHSPASEIYYLPADETADADVMISGYQHQSQRVPVSSDQYQSQAPNGMTTKRVSDDMDEECGSPGGSEISVGSNGLPAKTMQQSPMKGALVHSTAHGIQVQATGQYMTNMSNRLQQETGITIRTSQPQMIGAIKKDPNNPGLMLVDPGPYYQTGNTSQKVYRLVAANGDMDPQHISLSTLGQSNSGQPRRKRIALVPSSQMQHVQVSQSPSMPSTSRGRIGDDLILDDGIQESTIVIDNHCESENSPMLSDSPGMNSMLIGGHSQMVSGSGGVHVRQMSRTPTHHMQQHQHQPQHQPVYSTYDADVAFQALIASHLSRLNEDDKAIMKYSIQRILLDARFGNGTSSRLIQDEELVDAAAHSVVAHEMVSTNPPR